MHAAFPRRRAAPGWPLLATLGIHLLVAWSWRIAHPPAQESREERVFDLIPLPPPAPARPRVRIAPQPRTSIAPTPRTAPAEIVPAPEPLSPASDAPAAAADPFTTDAPPDAAGTAPDTMAGRARREAGAIDRELRKGKPGVPDVADTPWGRFRQGVEGAYKDSSRGLGSDTYTAPDGQVIYRFRLGGKTWCRTGGSVRPRIGGAEGGGAALFDVQGGAGSAGSIPCPLHADWKRD